MNRLFVGIDIPSKIKNEINKEIRILDFIPIPENKWHITLLFIGEVDDNQKESIIKKLSTIKHKSIQIQTKKIKNYKNMVWVEIFKKDIITLQEIIRKKYDLRRKIEKSYKPHINLGRTSKLFKNLKLKHIWQIKEFYLYQTQVLKNKSKYIKIKRFKLE